MVVVGEALMDITTLIYAALVALGLLAVDTALTSGSVVINVSGPPKTEKTEVDQAAVRTRFNDLLTEIVATKSLLQPPELIWSSDEGVGMAAAQSLGLEKVGAALKNSLGLAPDELRVSFYRDEGALRALVAGVGHSGEFEEILTQNKDEPLMDFVGRSSLVGVSELAPYATAVYLLQAHSVDKDFKSVTELIEHSEATLPPTPQNREKSLFDNLTGLIALFKNDLNGAETEFTSAMQDDPSNPVPFINAAFVDLQKDDYPTASKRMEQLIRLAPPQNNVVLGSAFMTWAAALMGLHDLNDADRLLAAATKAAPHSATAFGLWSELKGLQGDKRAADALAIRAEEETATFENYAEVAALYFHLAWENNKPIEMNKFNATKPLTY
jgi:tetratricopeptide (TPR) repeat protein